jgi:hypothetical protein
MSDLTLERVITHYVQYMIQTVLLHFAQGCFVRLSPSMHSIGTPAAINKV